MIQHAIDLINGLVENNDDASKCLFIEIYVPSANCICVEMISHFIFLAYQVDVLWMKTRKLVVLKSVDPFVLNNNFGNEMLSLSFRRILIFISCVWHSIMYFFYIRSTYWFGIKTPCLVLQSLFFFFCHSSLHPISLATKLIADVQSPFLDF